MHVERLCKQSSDTFVLLGDAQHPVSETPEWRQQVALAPSSHWSCFTSNKQATACLLIG